MPPQGVRVASMFCVFRVGFFLCLQQSLKGMIFFGSKHSGKTILVAARQSGLLSFAGQRTRSGVSFWPRVGCLALAIKSCGYPPS